MLFEKEYRLAYTCLKTFEKINLLPIYWEVLEIKVRNVSLDSLRSTWFGHSILLLDTIFLFYRVEKCYPDRILEILPNTLLLIIHLGTFAFRCTIWHHSEEYAALFNMCARFNKMAIYDRQEHLADTSKTRGKIFKLVIIFINACVFAETIQFAGGNITEFDSILSYVPYFGFVLLIGFDLLISFNYTVVLFMLSIITISSWLRKACIVWPQKNQSPLMIQKSFRVYRCCQILNHLQNIVFGTEFLPLFKLGMIFVICTCSFTVMIVRDRIPLPITIFFALYLVASLLLSLPAAMMMSQIYNISSNIHINISRHSLVKMVGRDPETQLLKRELKALPVLRNNIGSLYFMEGNAKMTFFHNMVTGIAFMVITYRGMNI